MNIRHILVIGLTVLVCLSPVKAQSASTNAWHWQKLSNDISVSLTLSDRLITIKVKNTSGVLKELLDAGTGSVVELYYVNGNGEKALLRDPQHQAYDTDDVEKNLGYVSLKPGEERSWSRVVGSDKYLLLVKTHSIECKLVVYDPNTQQKEILESTPKLLSSGP